MNESTLRRVVWIVAAAATINVLLAAALASEHVRQVIPTVVRLPLTWLVLVLPWTFLCSFVMVQILPGGRTSIELPLRLAHDAWYYILVAPILVYDFADSMGSLTPRATRIMGDRHLFVWAVVLATVIRGSLASHTQANETRAGGKQPRE
jgi:hypothetical protein